MVAKRNVVSISPPVDLERLLNERIGHRYGWNMEVRCID
jgi:hypothetical protein